MGGALLLLIRPLSSLNSTTLAPLFILLFVFRLLPFDYCLFNLRPRARRALQVVGGSSALSWKEAAMDAGTRCFQGKQVRGLRDVYLFYFESCCGDKEVPR